MIVNMLCFWNWPLPVHFVKSKWRSKVWRIHGQPRIPAQALGEKWGASKEPRASRSCYANLQGRGQFS